MLAYAKRILILKFVMLLSSRFQYIKDHNMFNQICKEIGLDQIKRCALIGSRKAPSDVLVLASTLGRVLSENNVIAHSGGAGGMDTAFMRYYSPERRKIFIPNWKFYDHRHNGKDVIALQTIGNKNLAMAELEYVCDDPNYLPIYMQNLFMRNVAQVLDDTFCDPVDCVIFWAKEVNGMVTGGTRIAVNIAKRHGIPCYNLWDMKKRSAIENILGGSSLDWLGI